MLFSESDTPKKGSIFKKLLILFNLLMIMNVLMVRHVESLKVREAQSQQEVADLGGDKDDFVNQQERALTGIRSNSAKFVDVVESDLDLALLNFANEQPSLYGFLNTYWHVIWIVGLLLFIGVSRLLNRRRS